MSFFKNESGNVALTFAIALVPTILAVGSAVDYSRMNNERSNTQGYIDAAALSATKEISKLSDAELKQFVLDNMESQMDSESFARILDLDVVVDRINQKLVATVNSATETTFLAVTGSSDIAYEVKATTNFGTKEMELVLVLDNTGSMAASGKMDALKASATSFVNSMMDMNSGTKTIKVSIVPFSSHVNVGTGKRHESWISVPADYSAESCQKPVISKSGCSMVDYTPVYDGVPGETRKVEHCTNIEYGPVANQCSTKQYEWQGCVGSRIHPMNLKDISYGTPVPGVLVQSGDNGWSCPSQEITDLTDNRTTLLNKIAAMVPKGNTYIPAGLTWGERVLSSHKPFNNAATPAAASTKGTQKVVVLMTDGDNQSSAQLPGSHTHYGNDLDEANQWTADMCANIKAGGTEIYTISFGTGVTGDTQLLMRNCATKPDNYFHVSASAQLAGAFDGILGDLTRVHLSN